MFNPRRRLSVKFADTEDYYYYQEQRGEKGEPEKPKKAQKKPKSAREQPADTGDQWVRKQAQESSNTKQAPKGPRNAQEPSGDNYRFNEGGARDPKNPKDSGSHEQLSKSADPKDRDGNYHFRKSQPKQYKAKDERNVNKKYNTEYEWVAKKDPKTENDASEQQEKPAGQETTGDGSSPAEKEDKADKGRPNFKDRNYGFLERRNNGKDRDGKPKGPVGKGQAYYVLKTKTEGETQPEAKPEEAAQEAPTTSEQKD